MWPSTTSRDWLTSRCCRTRSKQPRWAFCCGPWAGSMFRGSAARGCSPITAAPTAPGLGEKPAQHLVLHQNAPGHTRHDPTAKPSVKASSRLRLHQDHAGGVGGRTQWPFGPQLKGTAGCLAIWRSITAAGVIWPWLAAPPFSSSDCCGLLNDLVRKHT